MTKIYRSELTNGLRDDHDQIVRALTLLNRAINMLEKGLVEPVLVERILKFLSRFADQYHHGKEELILFPMLERRGMEFERGPLQVMVCEHGLGRYFLRNALRAVARYGDDDALIEVKSYSKRYFDLLIDHISKENKVLFMLADNYIEAEEGVREAEKMGRELGYKELISELEELEKTLTP